MFASSRMTPETIRISHQPPAQRGSVDRPVFFSGPARRVCGAVCLVFAFVMPAARQSSPLLKTLAAIYAEVKELGARPGQDFISWNFFIGSKFDGDDDDTNKDRHVAVMIQDVAGREKMTILVTRMEAVGGNPGVRNAAESKSLYCGIRDGIPLVLSSNFKEKEALAVALEILRAVRNKKHLLGSGRHVP